MTLRAGDDVAHGPSGETWTLACDEENGEVMPCGWPEGWAKAADCTLVKAASDAERLEMLRMVAATRGDHGERTHRASLAAHQLTEARAS